MAAVTSMQDRSAPPDSSEGISCRTVLPLKDLAVDVIDHEHRFKALAKAPMSRGSETTGKQRKNGEFGGT
jgi:hypothetical protein